MKKLFALFACALVAACAPTTTSAGLGDSLSNFGTGTKSFVGSHPVITTAAAITALGGVAYTLDKVGALKGAFALARTHRLTAIMAVCGALYLTAAIQASRQNISPATVMWNWIVSVGQIAGSVKNVIDVSNLTGITHQ